jgi:transcriptional regulator with XRE-family HTH domain
MKTPDDDTFTEAYRRRVREIRQRAGLKPHEVADVLGIKEDTYDKYETRGGFPPRHIMKFCLLCRAKPEELLNPERPLKRTESKREAS